MHRPLAVALALGCSLASRIAAPEDKPAPAAPYSLPWLLRSAVPATVVRLD